MVFSSSLFLILFLPVFLVVYYLADTKYKNLVAFVSSVAFYAWGAPKFIFIVAASIVIDYLLVRYMAHVNPKKRIGLIGISIALNTGLLLYFKYANFFVENLNALLHGAGIEPMAWTAIALPIGISFFTFQKMSYAIDVYRQKVEPLEKLTDYALYILLFPQLIAGPIVRFKEVADQILNRSQNENIDNKLRGLFRFVLGLSKKVLIANVMGAKADEIFALSGDDLSTPIAWVGILAYAFQIYFDFSGYSDMAIGIGRMIGFVFPENFDNPYISQNISEFWRRWHITLGRWMKDYLYIPLGGNQVDSKARLYFNLWVVFLISGFWHGASWNFLIWGAFHGIFLIADRMFLLKVFERIGKFPSIAITFLITLIGWVFFRAETLPEAATFIGKMFAFDFGGPQPLPLSKEAANMVQFNGEFWTIFALAIFFSFLAALPSGKKVVAFFFDTQYNFRQVLLLSILSFFLLFLCITTITSSGFNPFIYFRF